MFRKALLKTTGLYLLIIMAISLFFSLNLYRISTAQIQNSLRRQQHLYEGSGRRQNMWDDPAFIADREIQIEESKEEIVSQLIYTNLFILVFGGVLSYLLARATIRPIEDAHDAQARFTGDASHELRSPLAAMKSEIEVALRNPKITKEEAIAVLSSNLEEIDRLKYLADYLLDLARDEETSLKKERIAVKKLIDGAISDVQQKAQKRKVKIDKKVDADFLVWTHPESVRQILSIFLDNAIKYSESGTPVSISAGKDFGRIEIAVSDQGVGIKKEDQAKIFDRFYRADQSRTKNKTEGYGLGLSLAKKLADVSKIKIEVDSKSGIGSTFRLKF